MAQGYKGVTVTRQLWVRCPLEGVNCYLLILSFLRSGISSRNALKDSAKNEERSVLTLGVLCFLFTGYSVKLCVIKRLVNFC